MLYIGIGFEFKYFSRTIGGKFINILKENKMNE